MPTPPDTDRARLDADLAVLQARATEWARLPLALKIEMLEDLRPRLGAVAARWVAAASEAKGLPGDSPWRGEEWVSGPWAVLQYLEPLAETLRHVEAGTLAERVAGRVRQRPDGQTIVEVLPDGLMDRVLLSGVEAEVWQAPGVTPETLVGTMAGVYQDPAPEGAVALVLGAGNIASIPPLDVLYRLYAEGEVVLLKMNPVNAYLGPILEEAFAAFVEAGYLRIAYGDADVGGTLTTHEAVDTIHMTGSERTFDAIVFGTGPEAADRKRRDAPVNDKPFSSELGGVTPCVVVPGDWSEPDLDFQAERVVTSKMHNSGFNCIGTQLLVLPEAWPQREAFLDAVRRVLASLDDRPAYYPGAQDRIEAAASEHEDAERFGTSRLLVEIDPEADAAAFTEEFFGPVLYVATLPGGDDAGAWLDDAVAFCNERVMGTLGITVLVHPRTQRRLGDRFEDAVARLRYGTIGVNLWAGAGFFAPQAAWGAFPGHVRNDIQSGSGTVHNALLFGQPQKTVVTGFWAPFPRSVFFGERHAAPPPLWFVTNASAAETAEKVTKYAADPSALRLPGIVASALRG
ncbi:MAG: aldehyde dehydrogenase family protein [Bacteroidota bacterium]